MAAISGGMDASKGAPGRRLTLADSRFGPRPREILGAINKLAAAEFGALVEQSLADFDQVLFRAADQARNNQEQTGYLESIRLVKTSGTKPVQRYLAAIESDLAELEFKPAAKADGGGWDGALKLVDEKLFEENLALRDLAGRATMRFAEDLYALGQRFAVLAGAPSMEPESLALGPDRLTQAFGEATRIIEIPTEHRLMLYRTFERALLGHLGVFYAKVNALSIERRLLPNLIVTARRGAGAGAAPAAAATEPATEKATPEPEAPEAPTSAPAAPASGAMAAPTMPSGMGAGANVGAGSSSGGAWSSSIGNRSAAGAASAAPRMMPPMAQPPAPGAPLSSELPSPAEIARFPGLAGLLNPVVGWPSLGETSPAAGIGSSGEEIELVDTLLGLLQRRRESLGQTLPAKASPGVTPVALEGALAALQRNRHATARGDGQVPLGMRTVKEDLLNQLRAVTPAGETPQLSANENDTIDLLGMLIEELASEQRGASPVRDLLARLQVPMLRVALRDRAFFTSQSHPARRLLNAITESGTFWVDDQGEDTLLFERLRAMVDRITGEQDADINVFEDLLNDLTGFLGTLARKAEIAEKRHIETARGREKLEMARQSAMRAVANLLTGRNTAAIVRTVLEQVWCDVLALTILRYGQDQTMLERRLRVANQLIDAFDIGKQPPDADTRDSIRAELEAGFNQVGYHSDDARLIIDSLFESEAAAKSDNPVSMTEIAIKLKSRTRLGAETIAVPAAPKVEAPKPVPLTAEEASVRQHLTQTAFGTWFEFTVDGEPARRKLAWFSTMSGRCLFVNARGNRSEELTLDELARRIAAGTAAVVQAREEPVVDRAWKRILVSLKRFVGFAPTPAVA